MLQACCDCIFGYDFNRGGTRREESHIVQLNGTSNRAPPWPKAQLKNEKMFILPKRLEFNDTILISGTTYAQRRRLTIGLVTGYETADHSNVACQLDISFYDPNKIAIQIIKDGNPETVNEENAATDYFSDPNFHLKFRVRSENILDILVDTSHLESVELKHDMNQIKFITVHGDVERVSRLDFTFG